jgi:aspartyl-tRNA(Asn)/glutamyl-tRNA(Gln) amidotransferase subunit A
MRSGGTTARAAVEAALAEVARANAEVKALAEVTAEQALADADRCDREAAAGAWRGPLHGLPITVKDVIDVAGVPTRAGSDAYHERPGRDAAAVALLRAAGAVIVGKATTHEFALGVTSPQSRNPRDRRRIPGGSSGGSAISVATGMALASLGTDTRASIRVPAALSGVVGLKPTYGRIPTDGVVSLSWTMDHVAPMAATVSDAAYVLDVLDPRGAAGRPFRDAAGRPVEGLRVGVPDAAFAGAERGVAKAVARAVEAASALGCLVDNVERPSAGDLALANAAGLVVSRCEAATFHDGLALRRDLYWQEVAEQLELADGLRAVEYLGAQRARLALGEDLLSVFDACDVLAMPTVPLVAPRVDDFAAHLMTLARNAIPWSFVGFPALSMPCGTSEGLPVGLQLVAPPYREDRLVALGTALAAVLPVA